ncbi:CONT-like protein [Mya arenaria]|uniref:CONT-like protein n=1 Tax=Mya arenaria TaxID=6604 RepID=A0ABY7FYP1_MYAAR|nr:CONT-like protein [Mya arenaria]
MESVNNIRSGKSAIAGYFRHIMKVSVCPNDWIANEDRCYQFNIYPPRKYDDASRFCQTNGAALVSVTSMEEHQFLSARLAAIDKFKYDWYTSGERDPSRKNPRYVDNRYTVSNGKLSIDYPTDQKDTGTYQCKVKNPAGVIISSFAQLSFATLGYFSPVQTGAGGVYNAEIQDSFIYVYPPAPVVGMNITKPYFVMPLHDQHLDTGTQQLTWQCEARSVPFPTYTWYKDGLIITNSSEGDIRVHKNTLYLQNLDPKRDSGMYQCFAANSHGVSTTAAQLRILISGAIKGRVVIPCRPEAAPYPEFTWTHNGGVISPAENLEGGRIYRNIEGDLPLHPEEQGGWGIGYEVEYRRKPPPGNENANFKWTKEVVHGNVGEFSNEVGEDNYFLPYQIHYWLKDIQTQSVAQQNIIYGQTDHGMIIGLLPDTWYTVTVMVFNDAGNGVKGEKAYQSTDRYVIVDLERNVEGELFEIQTNTLYHLRVLGYSVGGEGKGSSPETLFSLMDRGRVMQVMVDPTTSDVQYILYRMEDAATPLFSMFTIVMAVFCAIFALLV